MDINRYNDPTRDHYNIQQTYQKQPMMVIRNYPAQVNRIAASTHTSSAAVPVTITKTIVSKQQHQHSPENNNYNRRNYHAINTNATATNSNHMYHQQQQHPRQPNISNTNHNSNHNNNYNLRKTDAYHKKKNCCNENTDDDEHFVDYHKMNSANLRSGFVKNSAAMWDRRAAENSTEFNTIV